MLMLLIGGEMIAKETNTKLYIGQGLYRYKDEGAWSNPNEIINQLKIQ